jgi:hypothetical protein
MQADRFAVGILVADMVIEVHQKPRRTWTAGSVHATVSERPVDEFICASAP